MRCIVYCTIELQSIGLPPRSGWPASSSSVCLCGCGSRGGCCCCLGSFFCGLARLARGLVLLRSVSPCLRRWRRRGRDEALAFGVRRMVFPRGGDGGWSEERARRGKGSVQSGQANSGRRRTNAPIHCFASSSGCCGRRCGTGGVRRGLGHHSEHNGSRAHNSGRARAWETHGLSARPIQLGSVSPKHRVPRPLHRVAAPHTARRGWAALCAQEGANNAPAYETWAAWQT